MPSFLKGRRLHIALAALALAYPFLVYFGLRIASPLALASGLLALLALRSMVERREGGRQPFARALWIAAAGMLAVVLLSPRAGLQSYPILLSLAFAALFAHSLWRPPTIIERIARLREPDLPPEALPYVRKVTVAWLGFCLANAAISAATAASGNWELWTLYNGFISYLIMGVLFVGEWILRGFLFGAKRDAA